MREQLNLNKDWYFKRLYETGMELTKSVDGFDKVCIPHTNEELPYSYFDEKRFQIVSCYKLPLVLPKQFKGKLVYVQFEGVMAFARVYLNGKQLCEHKGGYTPFRVRIDQEYDFDSTDNMLTVVADARELENIPPFGGQIDYLTYGGVYREVSVTAYDDVFIGNLKVETSGILEQEKAVKVNVHLENPERKTGDADLILSISERNGKEIYQNTYKTTYANAQEVCSLSVDGLKDIKLWDIDDPNLYDICVQLSAADLHDEHRDSFGFRTAEFKADGFYLNERKIKIKGLNRHQSYPYVGYAMPKRAQEKDAEILKNELHLNLARTSHYPQSRHFLNKCDELGLMVFEEIPGWQHIGNQEWKEVAKENVREMITRDWNHPSIILWGVRINESQDDDAFYTDTNQISHLLDGTRQTGGVRYITNSNLLEDVYTFNDFNHDGNKAPLQEQQAVTGLDHKVPYMVTEYNGHMYPTKRFDQEERQMEHALRHLRVQNAAFADPWIAGAIGWCAFDYNTHKDFGSGDRICYHGVMDMFRIPKFAAFAYSSQVSPEVEPILEPVTFWARGERSIGGTIPLVIFTNCDYIEFQYGDKMKKRVYPSRELYSGVEYPPVIIDFSVIKPEEAGAWGMVWEDAVFTGYHKDKAVVARTLSREPVPTKVQVCADDQVLCSKEKDTTRVTVKILDQCGNLLPFCDNIVELEIKGPGRIQGPQRLVLKGGCIAFWVETANATGMIEVEVKAEGFAAETVRIHVE